MGRKEYRFPSRIAADEAMKRLGPELERLVKKYELERQEVSAREVRLRRSGVDIVITASDAEVCAVVDLSWLVEGLARDRIEAALNEKVPPLLV
jgi:hypothetical protein